MNTEPGTCPTGRTRYHDQLAAHYGLPVNQRGLVEQAGEDCGRCGGVHLARRGERGGRQQ